MTQIPFLADGHQRALRGIESNLETVRLEIQNELEAEYTPKLAVAGFITGLLLKLKMKREFKRRFAEVVKEFNTKAPTDALYFKTDNKNKKKPLSD